MSEPARLPVHGMVLAGGLSSRMGTDKALLALRGVPLVASAVRRLAGFCAAVSIVGNRPDLQGYASVIPEQRMGFGPVAGLEAGLEGAQREWALFTPVDVPLVDGGLLRSWAASVLLRGGDGLRVSYLRVNGERQPTFCLLQRAVLPRLVRCAADQQRRVVQVLEIVAGSPDALWVAEAEQFARVDANGSLPDLTTSFLNVNTPEDWAQLQAALHGTQPVSDRG